MEGIAGKGSPFQISHSSDCILYRDITKCFIIQKKLRFMKNVFFPNEEITENDLYFVCSMIERIARKFN